MSAIVLFIISFIKSDYPAYRHCFEALYYFLLTLVLMRIRLFRKTKLSMPDILLTYLVIVVLIVYGNYETLFNDIENYNFLPALAFTIGLIYTCILKNRIEKSYEIQG